MPRATPLAWALAVAALLLLAPSAQASHMGAYRTQAVEHDAQGSVAEPDGLTTAVLGPLVTNCVLGLPPFGGRCVADPVPKPSGALGSTLAPGCTGADGSRRPDGPCGLWTVGVLGLAPGALPPPASEAGMAGGAAPGAYTPTKAHAVRFLDARVTWASQVLSTHVVDVDRRVAEAERLAGLGMVAGGQVWPGDQMLWAWYGQWSDRNGNGVVDHHTPGTAGPTQNEFTWRGNCLASDGARAPASVQLGLCAEDPNPHLQPPGAPCADPESLVACAGTTLHAWVFPGNHHGNALTGDLPGNQVLLWAQRLGDCSSPPTCDEVDRDHRGDPLLGSQAELAPDHRFTDRTGDPDDASRQWVGKTGSSSTFYGDDGLLVTLVEVVGVNCAPSQASALRLDPGSCTFLDVDRQRTVTPAAEELLAGGEDFPRGGLKGTARAAWLLVRDGAGVDTVQRRVDSVAQGQDLYLASQGPLRGLLDDLLVSPGWAREPNHPGDAYPGARFRACSELPPGDARNPAAGPDPEERLAQHRGACATGPGGEEGQAHALHRGALGRGWLDAQAVRTALYAFPLALVPGQACQVCLTGHHGVLATLPLAPEPSGVPEEAHDLRRTLGPGQYFVGGVMGRWRDLPHAVDESLFPSPPGTDVVAYPADGWVGVVQAASGQWRYRGFLPRACATEREPPMALGEHEAAMCDPYLGGHVEDPQRPAGDEFEGACSEAGLAVRLWPSDGVLRTQALVWRAYAQGLAPDPLDLDHDGQAPLLPRLEAWGPGPVEPLELAATCLGPAAWRSSDHLLWPEGNRGDDVLTRVAVRVALGADLDGDGQADHDGVVDQDAYAAWGAG